MHFPNGYIRDITAENINNMRSTFIISGLLITCFAWIPTWGQQIITNAIRTTSKDVGSINQTTSRQTNFATDFQVMLNSWDKGKETNGLICGIQRSSDRSNKPLVFYACVINTTTNWVKGYLGLPLQGLSEIHLFDSNGIPVNKSQSGNSFTIWSETQIMDWLKLRPRGINFFILPQDASIVNSDINLGREFQLKHPGEYTLHLKMCMMQIQTDKTGRTFHRKYWLPEVATKVLIRPDDILPFYSPTNGQTNPPAQ